MLYISGAERNTRTITDSETGESFLVVRDFNTTKYYRDNVLFNMDKVVGYMDDETSCVVPKQLISLLDYIDDVEFVENAKESIRVTWYSILAMSEHKEVLKINSVLSKNINLFDIILCMSFDDGFESMLKGGTLVASFGLFEAYLKISLCGDYFTFITKMIVLYRDTIKDRLDSEGYF